MLKHSATFSKKIKKNLLQNSAKAEVQRYGRDSFKYHAKSRSTIVEGELMHGKEDLDRIIFRYCPMKWSDNKEPLTHGKRKRAFKAVGDYLNGRKIRWKFSDFGKENWAKPRIRR
jgi:hypothetical protein